jgi:membrane glycosyltransferase
MKVKFIKKVEILSCELNLIWDKSHDGGSFALGKSELIIGIKSYKIDPLYTISIISHEVMEMILQLMGGRYDNGRLVNDFLFSFNHQTFENAIQLHTQTMNKFLI